MGKQGRRGQQQRNRLLSEAAAVFQRGLWAAAVPMLRQVLEASPDDGEALHYLGVALCQMGNAEEGARVLGQAVKARPWDTSALFDLGAALDGLGDREGALKTFRRVLSQAPGHFEAAYASALLLRDLGRLAEAEESFRSALALRPQPRLAILLAEVQAANGRVAEAIEGLSEAAQKAPGDVQVLTSLADLLLRQDRRNEASALHEVLREQLEKAAAILSDVADRQPANADVRFQLGAALASLGRSSEAAGTLREGRRLDPGNRASIDLLERVLSEAGDEEGAIKALREGLECFPEDASLRCSYARKLNEAGRYEEAKSFVRAELAGGAGSAELKALDGLLLPAIPKDLDQILESRAALRRVMEELRSEAVPISSPERSVRITPFFLQDQGLEDRELMEACAACFRTCSPHLNWTADLSRPALGGRRIRVGFLSAFMGRHPVGRVLTGFLRELDRERFEVVYIEVLGNQSTGREAARAYADETVYLTWDMEASRRQIEAAKLDVLLFGDVHMDPFTYFLAYSRLAPVQCTTWGHPGTSGLDTIDYWISCQDWEAEGNERLYTERLVRLPTMPMIYDRPVLPDPPPTRSEFGLPEDMRLYLCPQSLFKLHPEFDAYLGEILSRDDKGLLVLPRGSHPEWERRLRERWEKAFAKAADRVFFYERVHPSRFVGLLSLGAVMLDPIHFGGANTSMEGFTAGTPVVTQPGTQMRNRVTLSCYERMEYRELIVDSREAYVELALRIAQDPELRHSFGEEVRGRCDVLFGDVQAARHLESFFEEAAQCA